MGDDIEALDDPAAQELLASPQPIRLAYAGRDGFPQVRAVFDQQARIAITPDWARFYDFGAGRLPPFLHKLLPG